MPLREQFNNRRSELQTSRETEVSNQIGGTEATASMSHEDLRRTVQEMKVRQIELELQNEELRKTIVKLQMHTQQSYGHSEGTTIETEIGFRSFVENSPVIACLRDDHGRYIYVNKNWERFFHLEPESWRGRTAEELFPREIAERFRETDDQVMSTGRPAEFHEVIAGIKGFDVEERHCWIFKFIVRDAAGRSYLGGVGLDITEKKHAEGLLLKTRQEFEMALKGANLGWWEHDVSTGETFNDKRIGEILGLASDETKSLDQIWERLAHPDDKPRVVEAWERHLRGDSEVFEAEYRLRATSGDWKWIHVRGKVVDYDSEGNPLRVAGTYLDVTDRKLAEEASRQSEQRFRAIFEAAEDLIYVKDRSLRYVDVNPAVEKLFGLPASEVLGRQAEDRFSIGDAARIREIDERVLDGESAQGEYSLTINETLMNFLVTKVPLRNDSGEIVGILGIGRDISDRKEPAIQLGKIEYKSSAMQATLDKADLAAKKNITILLMGESGSGKDYLAKYVHDHSDRVHGPYFAINCAAIAPELAESELFGHEKGAFTGALNRKRGLLELAEGGTLLLNEVGELSLALQAKLLSFLDTRKFTRVGGEKEISVNARLIAATNRNLEREVEAGTFRKDLFYRLNVMVIQVPPLRERLEDIPILVREIMEKLSTELQMHGMPIIDSATIDLLKAYDWPGNVRELRNVLERALILSHGKALDLKGLGFSQTGRESAEGNPAVFSVTFPSDQSVNEITRELKSFLINEALRRAGGSRQGAAKLLGISRYSLKHYMKALGYSDV